MGLQDASASSLQLTAGRIVLPDRVVHADLFIVNGWIVKLVNHENRESYHADSILGLKDTTIFPGFIDIHIHGAAGIDTMDASSEQLSKAAQFLLTQGVTGWLPTLVPASHETYATAVDAVEGLISEKTNPSLQKGARALGVHYEGPFVNNAQCGALRAEYFKTYSSTSEFERLPVPKTKGAKMMMTLAPEVEGGLDLVRALNQRGWIVSIGHTRANPEVLDGAFEAGARHTTHFLNSMSS